MFFESLIILTLPAWSLMASTSECTYEKFRTITCANITTDYLFNTGLFTAKHMYRQFICTTCNLGNIPAYTFNVKDSEGDRASFIILDLTACNVTNLEKKTFYGQEVLRRLLLPGNAIVEVAGMFEPLKHLEWLDLEGNRIEVLRKKGFSGLLHLSVLNLEGNRIGEVEEDAFEGLENLQVLKLDRNLIKTLDGRALQGLLAIESISLRFNLLESINYEAFANFTYLLQLSLEKNHLKEISVDLLQKATTLKKLDVSSNPLQTISSKALTSKSLEELYIRNCSLPMVKNLFANLPNLRILDLSYNALTEISLESFARLKYLTALNFSRNSISHVACSNTSLSFLKTLDFSSNVIADIDYVCVFADLPELRRISFLGNPLPEYIQIEILEYIYGVNYTYSDRKSDEKNSALVSAAAAMRVDVSLKAVYVCFSVVFVALLVLGGFLYRVSVGMKDLDNSLRCSTVPLLDV